MEDVSAFEYRISGLWSSLCFFFKCGLKKAGLTINEVKRVDLIGKHKNSKLNLNYSFNYERLGKRKKKKKRRGFLSMWLTNIFVHHNLFLHKLKLR